MRQWAEKVDPFTDIAAPAGVTAAPRLVAVANNPKDAISALRALEPNPKRGMVIEAARPVVDVIR